MDLIRLSSAGVAATIDPGQGADLLSLIDRRTGIDVLFRSPWRERADSIRAGHPASSYDPTTGWLERYRGGWQTLCPNAGDPRRIYGASVGFHGEAASVAWTVDGATANSARLHVELFTVPVRIERTVELTGSTLRITDSLSNLSTVPIEFDYSHHPAFGGRFLEGTCRIQSGATRFTPDPQRNGGAESGSAQAWPWGTSTAGDRIDLRDVAPVGEARAVFGWLDGFTEHWASITNLDLDLTVRLEWDGAQLPYAWLWQELGSSEGFPWYQRARVVAIEPASTQTSGAERRSVLRLGARETTQISISATLENGSDHE